MLIQPFAFVKQVIVYMRSMFIIRLLYVLQLFMYIPLLLIMINLNAVTFEGL